MIQAQLNIIKEEAAGIVGQYTNGHVNAYLEGTGGVESIFNHCLRLHYLWGVLKETRLSGGSLYVGDTEISGSDIEQVFHKIWHYKGIFADVDLSDYSAVETDDGDSGTCDGDTTTTTDDHYRASSLSVSTGGGTVTFSSPLSSSDYTLTVYVVTASGYEQRNIVVGTKYPSGFTYEDVLEAGTLHYFAVLDL